MRFFSIITSIAVVIGLYLVIMERDTLRALANGEEKPTQEQVAEKEADISEKPPIAIVARASQAQEVEAGIVLRGRTEAGRRLDVRAETSGLVISEPLRRGTMVESNRVLCELDPGTSEVTLLEARARLTEAQANDRASASLVKKGYTSETAAIGRKASLQSAEAQVQKAERAIENLTVLAPFSGILESDTAEIGSFLQPGQVCATIIDLKQVKLVGFVPERDVGRLKVGAKAGARLITDENVFGQLTFVSRSADPQTRTFRVEVTVPNADLEIRDGTTAEIFIALAGEKAHLLPQSVLTLNDNGELGIRAAVDGIAKFMAVEVVRDAPEGIWLAGLPETVNVIVVGQDFVIDGRRIEATFQEASQ